MTESVVRARLRFAYDGTDFAGWAAQPDLRTVQGELEAALARILRQEGAPRVVVAGRTDAGVHARGQVAHVDINPDAWAALPARTHRHPGEALTVRLNGVLPADIVISHVDEAPAGFDARFSALERRYAYRIADASVAKDPLLRRHVAWLDKDLDVAALNNASNALVGLRDFAAFCKAREGATTIRDLKQFDWTRVVDGPDSGLLVATVRADAFCHSMVRGLVGAVLAVGHGKRDIEWLSSVAQGRERSSAVTVAPAAGLTLEEVVYPQDGELADRADQTRAKRTLD